MKPLGRLPNGNPLFLPETSEERALIGQKTGVLTGTVPSDDGPKEVLIGTVHDMREEGEDAVAPESDAGQGVRSTTVGYTSAYARRFDEIFKKGPSSN